MSAHRTHEVISPPALASTVYPLPHHMGTPRSVQMCSVRHTCHLPVSKRAVGLGLRGLLVSFKVRSVSFCSNALFFFVNLALTHSVLVCEIIM